MRAGEDSCIGITRGGKTTKIHALVNGQGLPVRFLLSAGNREDFDEAIPLLEQVPDLRGSRILGDRAYGTKKVRGYIQARGGCYTIPPTKNLREPWAYDKAIYRRRNVVERFFCRLKQFRRVATRYDKRAASFRAILLVSAISILFAILHN